MASYAYTFTSGDTVTPTKLNNARTVSEIVNADVSATAAIAHTKLASITAGQVLLGNASNVPTSTVLSGDVTVNSSGVTAISSGVIVDADVNASAAISLSKLATGALPTAITVASANLVDGTIVNADINAAAAIDLSKLATGALPTAITVASANLVDGTIVNADINASASIADTKLATISTAGKVSNSATTATNANTANAIVARDSSGNFSAGTITASLSGNVTGNVTGNLTGTASAIADSTVTNAKVAAGAAIADTKLATISTAGKVSNSATTATNANTANAIVARDASGNFSAGTITASLSGNVTGNLTGTASAIADGSVSTAKIVDANVNNAKLASDIDASKLTTGTLPIARIADAAVTPTKLSQPLTLATAQNTTSGTSIDFTSIPSWVRRITVIFNGTSLNGSANLLIQIGAGSITNGGYISGSNYLTGGTSSGFANSGVGIVLITGATANAVTGSVVFTLQTGNTWVAAGTYVFDNLTTTNGFTAGKVALSGTLDRLRITNTASDTFDAGSVNIMYEG
jgi:hypothetical protein